MNDIINFVSSFWELDRRYVDDIFVLFKSKELNVLSIT